MEVRDWVMEAAGQHVGTVQGAIAALSALEPDGNWSVEQDDGQWYLFTGDQWVGRATDEAEFAAFIAGVAVAVATVPKSR